MFDCHMHTRFSADSQMTIEEIENKIKGKEIGVILTEHMDIDFPGDVLFEFEVEDYFNTYGNHRSDKLLLGVEVGLETSVVQKNSKIIQDYEFDFVLGSLHIVDRMDLCGEQRYYENKTKQEAYERYFKTMYENIKAFHNFDSLGHLDYIARYCPYDNPEIVYEDFKEYIDVVLRQVVEKDIVIELNTRRFPIPGTIENYGKILQHYKEIGGKYVTCGSDAHQIEAVGYGLIEAKKLAESIGLQPVYFKKRHIHLCKD